MTPRERAGELLRAIVERELGTEAAAAIVGGAAVDPPAYARRIAAAARACDAYADAIDALNREPGGYYP